MRYVIYIVLLAVVIFIKGIEHILSFNSGFNDAGNMGEFIGEAIFAPLIIPPLVSAIVCFFRKNKTKGSLIRGCSWVLGLILIASGSNVLRQLGPKHYTFNDARITVTTPNSQWKMKQEETEGITVDFLYSRDLSIFIAASRVDDLHSVADINNYTQQALGEMYDPSLYHTLPCYADNFTCAYQEVTLKTKSGIEKDVDYFYLINNGETTKITVVVTPEKHDKKRQMIMDIIKTARAVER